MHKPLTTCNVDELSSFTTTRRTARKTRKTPPAGRSPTLAAIASAWKCDAEKLIDELLALTKPLPANNPLTPQPETHKVESEETPCPPKSRASN